MILQNNNSQKKAEITYPTSWSYRLIGFSKEKLKQLISNTFQERHHIVAEKNKSKTGKYLSIEVTLIVSSEEERNFFFDSFKQSPDVKMVL
jgi:putative lipoic acid-binding regulatory protein